MKLFLGYAGKLSAALVAGVFLVYAGVIVLLCMAGLVSMVITAAEAVGL